MQKKNEKYGFINTDAHTHYLHAQFYVDDELVRYTGTYTGHPYHC